jgi:hypothetical protein
MWISSDYQLSFTTSKNVTIIDCGTWLNLSDQGITFTIMDAKQDDVTFTVPLSPMNDRQKWDMYSSLTTLHKPSPLGPAVQC